MAELIKRIVTSNSNLLTLLQTIGFTVNSDKIYWGQAGTTNCYWQNNNGEIEFITSEGNQGFPNTLTDFTNSKNAGVMFTSLYNGGCVLYIRPLDSDKTLRDLNFNCNPAEGGLVCVTPPEKDGYWRFTWRYNETNTYKWCIDNAQGKVNIGVEIPYKRMINVSMVATLVKAYMESGDWSNYIFVQVLGDIAPPGAVFKINGQKYIVFNDYRYIDTSVSPSPIIQYRCPAFKLPPQQAIINPSTSTEEYTPIRIYSVGDYCIYNGLLYRCIQMTLAGEPFNPDKWLLTTVYNEKNNG